MSNRDRKARKRARIKFEREPKEGTPLIKRLVFRQQAPAKQGRQLADRQIELSSAEALSLSMKRRRVIPQARNFTR